MLERKILDGSFLVGGRRPTARVVLESPLAVLAAQNREPENFGLTTTRPVFDAVRRRALFSTGRTCRPWPGWECWWRQPCSFPRR